MLYPLSYEGGTCAIACGKPPVGCCACDSTIAGGTLRAAGARISGGLAVRGGSRPVSRMAVRPVGVLGLMAV